MNAEKVLAELAIASIQAGLKYMQLKASKEAEGKEITWDDVDALTKENDAMLAQFDDNRPK